MVIALRKKASNRGEGANITLGQGFEPHNLHSVNNCATHGVHTFVGRSGFAILRQHFWRLLCAAGNEAGDFRIFSYPSLQSSLQFYDRFSLNVLGDQSIENQPTLKKLHDNHCSLDIGAVVRENLLLVVEFHQTSVFAGLPRANS
jgi:hypothetical protein